jgi:hypothetical protein
LAKVFWSPSVLLISGTEAFGVERPAVISFEGLGRLYDDSDEDIRRLAKERWATELVSDSADVGIGLSGRAGDRRVYAGRSVLAASASGGVSVSCPCQALETSCDDMKRQQSGIW